MRGEIEVTIEELGHQSSLDVRIEYDAQPGEPMVRYYPNGDGYPGSPPTADYRNVYVKKWFVADEERRRSMSWLWAELDFIAEDIILNNWETYHDLCVEDADSWAEER